MLKGKDLNKELKVIDENAKIKKEDIGNIKTIILKSLLKGVGLIVKLVRDIKTNQTTIMKHNNISLVKDENKRGDSNENKENR